MMLWDFAFKGVAIILAEAFSTAPERKENLTRRGNPSGLSHAGQARGPVPATPPPAGVEHRFKSMNR